MNHPPTESGAATRIALLPLVLRASALLIELVSFIVFLSLWLDLSLPIFLSRSLLPHPSSHLFLFRHSRTAILHFTANLFFLRFALCETEKVEVEGSRWRGRKGVNVRWEGGVMVEDFLKSAS